MVPGRPAGRRPGLPRTPQVVPTANPVCAGRTHGRTPRPWIGPLEIPAEDWSARRRLGLPEDWCPAPEFSAADWSARVPGRGFLPPRIGASSPELATTDWSARAPCRGLVFPAGWGGAPLRPRGTTRQAGSGEGSREPGRKLPAAPWVWLPGRAAHWDVSQPGVVCPARLPGRFLPP